MIQEFETSTKTDFPEELKIATLIRCVAPELRLHLQLNISERTTYQQVRQLAIMFEQNSSNWTTQQVLSQFQVGSHAKDQDGPTDMDISRVEGDKGKGKGKGKGYKGDKGKGKGKGKGYKGDKGKDSGKGYGGKFGGKSNYANSGKGYQQQGWNSGYNNRYNSGYHNGWNSWQNPKGFGKQGNAYQQNKGWHGKDHGGKGKQHGSDVRSVGMGDKASVADGTSTVYPSASVSKVLAQSAPHAHQTRFQYSNTVRRIAVTEQHDIWSEPDLVECRVFDLRDETESLDSCFDHGCNMVSCDSFPDVCFFDLQYSDGDAHWTFDPDICMNDSPELLGQEYADLLAQDHRDEGYSDLLEQYSFPDVCSENDQYLRACTDEVFQVEQAGLRFILDSGSDCSILPLHMAHCGIPGMKHSTCLRDAQGKVIKGPKEFRDVELHLQDRSGALVKLKERFVVAAVSQPLLSMGKFMKQGWQVTGTHPDLFLAKDDVYLPVCMQKNSLAMDLQICRITDDGSDGYRVHLSPEWQQVAQQQGWSNTRNGEMVQVSFFYNKYLYPDKDLVVKHFPYRSTLIHVEENEWEVLECAELYARKRRDKDIEVPGHHTVLTVFHSRIEDLSFWGPNLQTAPDTSMDGPIMEETAEELVEDLVAVARPDQSLGQVIQPLDQGGEQLGPEDQPELGPEVLEVNGQTLNPQSPLREIRKACQWLGLSKNGSKDKCWTRLKAAVAEGRRNLVVESAKILLKDPELVRDPVAAPLPSLPSLGEQEKHMITHLPRADWCEACQAARSREDNFKGDGPTRRDESSSVLSLDYMFTGKWVHLMVVDTWSKMCHAIPVQGKGAVSLKTSVDEINRLTNFLSYHEVTLRTDKEPSMVQLCKVISALRERAGLKTKTEHVPKGAHQGNPAERYISGGELTAAC